MGTLGRPETELEGRRLVEELERRGRKRRRRKAGGGGRGGSTSERQEYTGNYNVQHPIFYSAPTHDFHNRSPIAVLSQQGLAQLSS